MVESHVGKLELVTPGDVVELVEGMQDLYIMGTVDGFQKVTKIDGLENMSALTVRLGGLFSMYKGGARTSFRVCISPPPATTPFHALSSVFRALLWFDCCAVNPRSPPHPSTF